LIIADAALETIPKELLKSPGIVNHALSKRKRPNEILLDRSYHHQSMKKLKHNMRRGRPDIVHIDLIEATSSPLYLEKKLRICVHTISEKAIFIGESVRLPKSYFRFEGLFEKLFKEKKIYSQNIELLSVTDMKFEDLVKELRSTLTIGLSRNGVDHNLKDISLELLNEKRPVIVIGGFPRNSFTSSTKAGLDNIYSISDKPLDANIVIGRIIYEYEKALGK
jgi:rRNA small subunit pseudouridine methyltransferase Nep1